MVIADLKQLELVWALLLFLILRASVSDIKKLKNHFKYGTKKQKAYQF